METEQRDRDVIRPPSEDCLPQIQRILQSPSFRNALTLQQLLQYLATRALDANSEPIKEYTIGVEAFGRPQDFDPKTDTIVRVQVHRLKQKLREYYESEGRRDPIVVEIPKEQYVPSFFEVAGDHETKDNRYASPVASNLDAYSPSDLVHKNPIEAKRSRRKQERFHPGPARLPGDRNRICSGLSSWK